MTKVIAITGNSGKTSLSYFLGKALTYESNDICVIISTNNYMPTLQLLTERKTTVHKSLGKLLSSAVITEDAVTKSIIRFKNNTNYGYISYSKGETISTYPKVTQENVQKLIDLLRGFAKYIIVDTQTPQNDIDNKLYPLADINLCVLSADIKGLSYLDCKNEHDAQLILLNNHPNNPLDEVERTFPRRIKYILPFCRELQSMYNGIEITDVTPKKAYLKVVKKIALEVIKFETTTIQHKPEEGHKKPSRCKTAKKSDIKIQVITGSGSSMKI